ncbi:MAG: malonyl-CoA decarboxylase [Candidatus Binatia bacterium]|nr:malonyl-CoA decarboxylase [Candidatus Binatia bacterium]
MSTHERDIWRRRILECLEGPGGEVSARARAADLARAYAELDRDARRRFLTVLAEDFAPGREAVTAAIASYQNATNATDRVASEAELRAALTPPRRRLLTQFNGVEGGVKFLVDMRADLLSIASQSPELGGLDEDLKKLLVSWLDFGFLELTRLTWRSPALLLEKLIAYEAVHAIRDWEDLRNRLDSDRRCYGLFHPSMPAEPLAFVEVALCVGVSRSVQTLLDETAPAGNPRHADTAVFYSISSPQTGLRGISFGEYLIKRAVDVLSHDLPRLTQYATLSPIPGFRVWLDTRLARQPEALHVEGADAQLAAGGVRQMLDERSWTAREAPRPAISETLLALCARYFAERRADGQPIDPVARFHLRNGARLDRINWLGDVSHKGIRQSLGLMVNYRYDQDDIDANHEAYAKERELAVSPAVRDLMGRSGVALDRIRAAPEPGG